MKKKAIIAASRFLERKGYQLLDTSTNDSIIVAINTDNELVFVAVTATKSEKEFTAEEINQAKLELYAIQYLLNHPKCTEMKVRFDAIDLFVIDDRALLRHHINAINK